MGWEGQSQSFHFVALLSSVSLTLGSTVCTQSPWHRWGIVPEKQPSALGLQHTGAEDKHLSGASAAPGLAGLAV